MNFGEYGQRLAAARFRDHDHFLNKTQNAFIARKVENSEKISVNEVYDYEKEERKLWEKALGKRDKPNSIDELQELHERAERAKKIVAEMKKRGEL